MKRMTVLAALLAAASACTPAEQGGNANLTPSAANTATPQASPAAVSDADIIAVEHQIWDAIKAKNWDAFASHLTDDMISVLADGLHDKARTVEGVKKLALTDYTLSDTKVLKLDQDAAVLLYTSSSRGTYEGQPLPGTPSRDSSIYVKRGDRWLAIFHQETVPAPSATPPPAGAAANANSAAASPAAAASPTAAVPPAPAPTNVTDAEKQVWEALKRKDWDAFAAFLADDALEVEPEGIFNKAQSVEMVKQIDFSTATLSDFQELKLDADASVLTYLVRGTGQGWPPDGMRHTTVWVNRGGKWLAAFHQGTVVMK